MTQLTPDVWQAIAKGLGSSLGEVVWFLVVTYWAYGWGKGDTQEKVDVERERVLLHVAAIGPYAKEWVNENYPESDE